MPQIVIDDDLGQIEFPDGMSNAEMAVAIRRTKGQEPPRFQFAPPVDVPPLTPLGQREAAKADIRFQNRKEQERIAGTDSWLAKQNQTIPGQANAFMQEAQRGTGGVLQGLAPLADEDAALFSALQDPHVRAAMNPDERQKLIADIQARAPKTAQETIARIQSNPMFQAGKELRDTATETFPVLPNERDSLATKVSGAAGQFFPLIATGPAAPATIGLQSYGEHIDNDYQQMIDAGVPKEEAAQKTLDRALGSGALQAGVFWALPKPLRKAGDKYLIDKFAPLLGEKAVTRFIASRAAQVGEGAVLGAASRAGENVVTGQPVGQGVGEAAAGLALIQGVTPRGLTPQAQEQRQAFESGPSEEGNFFARRQAAIEGANAGLPGRVDWTGTAQAPRRPTSDQPFLPSGMIQIGEKVPGQIGTVATLPQKRGGMETRDVPAPVNAEVPVSEGGIGQVPELQGPVEDLGLQYEKRGGVWFTVRGNVPIIRDTQPKSELVARLEAKLNGEPNAIDTQQQQESAAIQLPRTEARPTVSQDKAQVRQGESPSPNDSNRVESGAQSETPPNEPLLTTSGNRGAENPRSGAELVKGGVLTPRNHLEILNSVIVALPVPVVNDLGGQQLATDLLLHQPSVFGDRLASNLLGDIVSIRNFLEGPVASARAKLSETDATGGNGESIAALDALNNHLGEILRRNTHDSGKSGNLNSLRTKNQAPLGTEPSSEPSVGLNPKIIPTESASNIQHGENILQQTSGGNSQSQKSLTPSQILNQAPKLKVTLPEGATMVRVTDTKGRTSSQFITQLNKGANPFRGVDIAKVEAGIVDKNKKFKVVPGEVGVEEAGKIKPAPSNDVPPGQRVSTEQVKQTPPAESTVPESVPAVKRVARGSTGAKRFAAETELNGSDILSWIHDNMRLMSKSAAKEAWGKEKFELNKSLWDDASAVQPHHNVIYAGGKAAPDRVAQAAYDARVLKEPSVNALWTAIKAASDKRKNAFATGKREAAFLKAEADEHVAWIKATSKGEERINADQLKIGDAMEVDGERIEVVDVDAEGNVTLKDGRRFGKQTLKEGQTIHVQTFEPAKEKAFVELLSTTETPFNLTGERGSAPEVKPPECTTGFGNETLAQKEMFAIQQITELKDPGKSADAAQQMYGDPEKAAKILERQLAVTDSDPKTRKAFVKEQRERLKEVIALLRQRAEPTPEGLTKDQAAQIEAVRKARGQATGIQQTGSEGANESHYQTERQPADIEEDLRRSGKVLWTTQDEIERLLAGASRADSGGDERTGIGEPLHPAGSASRQSDFQKAKFIIGRGEQGGLLERQSNLLAHRVIYGTESTDRPVREVFVGTLARKLATLKFIVRDLGDDSGIMQYDRIPGGDYVSVDATSLTRADFSDPTTRARWDAVMGEELIHAVTFRVSTERELLEVWKSLSSDERQRVKRLYRKRADQMQDFQWGAEYVRAIIQERLTGSVSEGFRERISEKAKSILRGVLDFLRSAFGRKPADSIARQIVERIEGAIRGDPIPEKPIDGFGKSVASGIKSAGEDEERRVHQVAGQPQGETYKPENIKAQQEIIRLQFFDATAPANQEQDDKFWEMAHQMTDRTQSGQNADVVFKTVRDEGHGGEMAPGLMKAEMQRYALKTAVERGDRTMLEFMVKHDADFAISAGGGRLGSQQSARELRSLQEFSQTAYWQNLVRMTNDRTRIAGEQMKIGAERFHQLMDTIDALKVSPDELEKVLNSDPDLQRIFGNPEGEPDELLKLISMLPLPDLPAELTIKTKQKLREFIDAQFPRNSLREKFAREGADKLARQWWSILSDKPQESEAKTVHAADQILQRELSGILKETLAKLGFEKSRGVKITDAENLAMVLGKAELRGNKWERVDGEVRSAIEAKRKTELADAKDDPELQNIINEKYDQLADTWDTASDALLNVPASDRMLRRMVHAELKTLNVKWNDIFRSKADTMELRKRAVDAALEKVQAAATNRLDLRAARSAMEGAFGQIEAKARNRFTMSRGRRTSEPSGVLDNQRVAEGIMDAFEKKQGAEVVLDRPKRNVVRQIIAEFLKPTGDQAHAIAENSFKSDLIARLTTPEVGVEPLTARRLAQAAWNQALGKFADRNAAKIERAANSKNIRGLIEDILNRPYQSQHDPQWRRQMAMNWFLSNGLSRDQAKAATELFDKQFQAAYQQAGEKAARDFLKDHADFKLVNDVIHAVRLGLTDPSRDWADEIASRGKFKPMTQAQHDRLASLELQLSNPELSPPEQVTLIEQMHAVLRHTGANDGAWWRFIGETHAASLLSGPRTAGLHIFQPATSLIIRDMPVAAVFQPRDLLMLAKALLESGRNFFPEFSYAWQKDAYAFSSQKMLAWHSELKRQFEIGVADLQAGRYLGALRLTYAWGQYVHRFLQTANQAGMAVVREWKLSLYGSKAMRDAGFNTKQIGELADVVSSLKKAAYDDGMNRGLDKLTARVRADYVAAEQLKDFFANKIGSDTEAAKIARNAEADAWGVVGRNMPGIKEEDEGWMRHKLGISALMRWSTEMRRAGGARSVFGLAAVGFVSIPMRTALFNANFFGYGILRWGVYKYRTSHGQETPWKQSFANDAQAKQRLHEALVGTALTFGALGWAWSHTSADDDVDKAKYGVYVTGHGPRNKTLRDAWDKQGFKPNSIVVVIDGKVRGNIPITRVGGALAWPMGLAASHDDLAWRHKEARASGRDTKFTITSEMAHAAGTYAEIVGAQGIFQGISHFMRMAEQGNSAPKMMADTASGTLGAIAQPGKQFFTTMQELLLGSPERSSIESIVAANMPIPNLIATGAGKVLGRDWSLTKPAINRFGDQLYDRTWYGVSSRLNLPFAIKVAQNEENSVLYGTLLEKGAAPPDLRRTIVEEKYGPLTDDQWTKFAKTDGAALKAKVTANLPAITAMAPDAAKKFLTAAAHESDQTAVAALGLETVKTAKAGGVGAGESSAGPSISSPAAGATRGAGTAKAPTGLKRLTTGRAGSPRLSYGGGRGTAPVRLSSGRTAHRVRLVHGRLSAAHRTSPLRGRARIGLRKPRVRMSRA